MITPSKLKCGFLIWENLESIGIWYWKSLCLPKVFANEKEKKKCSLESTRNIASNFPIPSNCTISCKRDRAPIALSLLERFGISDPPAHNLTEQNGNLFIIPQGFRISDPPSRQETKKAICSKFLKVFRISDLPLIGLQDRNSCLLITPQGFRIFDPPSHPHMDTCSWL